MSAIIGLLAPLRNSGKKSSDDDWMDRMSHSYTGTFFNIRDYLRVHYLSAPPCKMGGGSSKFRPRKGGSLKILRKKGGALK